MEITPQEDQEEDPDKTIRLIGGGGTSGFVTAADGFDDSDGSPELAEVISLSSTISNDVDPGTPTKPGKAKHEKKKSFSSGLKRLSKLGGSIAKRRTDTQEVDGAP